MEREAEFRRYVDTPEASLPKDTREKWGCVAVFSGFVTKALSFCETFLAAPGVHPEQTVKVQELQAAVQDFKDSYCADERIEERVAQCFLNLLREIPKELITPKFRELIHYFSTNFHHTAACGGCAVLFGDMTRVDVFSELKSSVFPE